ncbi:ClbS/DfsB family four-helix bundle protein [Actinoplanes sp. NPDC049802]|uniref:ClbS/DfsB family four-helix bundle protein n=1 Tax=Actinoplanes sp. NPDC049802 TaxID=3154742 RepID=UPI0033C0CEF7
MSDVARPTTRSELLEAAGERFERLVNLVDSMTAEEQNATFDFGSDPTRREAHWSRDRNVRDVLVHVHEWHQLLLDWVAANQKGTARPFLPEPYNWTTYGQMNVELWRKHQSTPLAEARAALRSSHEDVLQMMQQFTTEELFEKKRFPWTGTTSLGSYCVSATSSHYDWAMKKLRAHRKAFRAAK